MSHWEYWIQRCPWMRKINLWISLFILSSCLAKAQTTDSIIKEHLTFQTEGVRLSGTLYKPGNSHAAVVIVHGSGQEPRMTEFAELLANNGITVLTYDKRGVGESEGIYAGPEVGTNNIDSENLDLLAKDASAAVNLINQRIKNMPVGLVGFSQAGWIIPMAAEQNPLVEVHGSFQLSNDHNP